MCLLDGYVPHARTMGTIIPIPKPSTAKFRPISYILFLQDAGKDSAHPSDVSATCGLIVSSHKSRIFSCRPPATLPDFTVGGGTIIPLCLQYRYLGAPVRISAALPARCQSHPIVLDLLERLQRRLRPLQWVTNNSSNISIPVARSIYITFIRSVIDSLLCLYSTLSGCLGASGNFLE
ncbi:hypothetical protein E2C01_042184 [Portunus trituberculatus]|uniref:RNA-directed DNA polymerase from mobile element jockey n=1 Tax=Portunus trituberculatus TaxID=210409 RepID=A0A5B7FPI6_PORTR|nr:hypothetical protein [Portunus trituberculatus]